VLQCQDKQYVLEYLKNLQVIQFFKQIIRKFEKLILKYKSMFLEADILNEGKAVTNSTKRTKTRLSEGKNPKSDLFEPKSAGCKSTKTHACVNSNWQKLRR